MFQAYMVFFKGYAEKSYEKYGSKFPSIIFSVFGRTGYIFLYKAWTIIVLIGVIVFETMFIVKGAA